MNQLLLFALMNGSHRHRYTDASGICAACHRPHSPHTFENGVCSVCGFAGCEHPDGFVDNGNELTHVCPVCGATNPHAWFQQTTAVNCQACSVCGATRAHEWENGVCVVCDYSCQHPEWLPNGNRHKCKICALTAPHELSFAHDYNCQVCDVCGGTVAHDFPNRTASRCGTCSVCGDTRTSHDWTGATGYCRYCNYECLHPQGVDSQETCPVCGKRVYYPGAEYRVFSGKYAGSYKYAGTVNSQRYYRQYVWDGEWVTGVYYLVVLNITTPTQFGGNYAYTGSGAAFVTTIANFPINDTLLEGNGRYQIHLEQYNLDGSFRAEADYTSPDCENLTGVLP